MKINGHKHTDSSAANMTADLVERVMALLAFEADYAPGQEAVEAKRRMEEIQKAVLAIFNRL